jgi:hypothetical protein
MATKSDKSIVEKKNFEHNLFTIYIHIHSTFVEYSTLKQIFFQYKKKVSMNKNHNYLIEGKSC